MEGKIRVTVQVEDAFGSHCPLAEEGRQEIMIVAELRLNGEAPNLALGDPLVGMKAIKTQNGVAVFTDLQVVPLYRTRPQPQP